MKQVLDENLPAEQPTEILDLDDLEGRIAQNSYDENLAKLMRENGVVYSHNNKVRLIKFIRTHGLIYYRSKSSVTASLSERWPKMHNGSMNAKRD